MNPHEQRYINRIVRKALAENVSISVFDGCDWAIKGSTNMDEIMDALGATEEDTLTFVDLKSGERLGFLYLTYGNEEYATEEVVCDYSDNDFVNDLLDL